MTKRSNEQIYTDPDLREKIKEEIKESDKGGRPGQWSARKSQLLTREYEKRGGGYTGDKDESQKNLEKWTAEEWQTQEGNSRARSGDETARYLPKEAWEKMSDEEKKETEEKKREGSKQGQQHVANTQEAKQARYAARRRCTDSRSCRRRLLSIADASATAMRSAGAIASSGKIA